MRNQIKNDYFKWLVDLASAGRYDKYVTYNKLLTHLHSTRFKHIIRRDANRANDGVNMRRRFALLHDEDSYDLIIESLRGPCSMLEMMIALAIRCEEDIMNDSSIGDRTKQWFWGMVVSLGLGPMHDAYYDRDFVTEVLDKFVKGLYEPDGRGGLFTIPGCREDLRNVEIWYQLCWYLDTIA